MSEVLRAVFFHNYQVLQTHASDIGVIQPRLHSYYVIDLQLLSGLAKRWLFVHIQAYAVPGGMSKATALPLRISQIQEDRRDPRMDLLASCLLYTSDAADE